MSDQRAEDGVNFIYRTMVERDPGKRRVKPVDRNMMELNLADLDDSSDDSDFKVPDHSGDDSNSDEESDDESKEANNSSEDEEDEDASCEDEQEDNTSENSDKQKASGMTIGELLAQAKQRQAQARQRIAGEDTNTLRILICCVCLGDISEEEDEIVECDGCGVSVHEGCYGITEAESVSSTVSSSSTEPWFCDSCKAGNTNPVCELCPNTGGIFKETDVGKWVHLVCALYIPGVAFGDVEKLSPVTLFEMPYNKWGAKPCGLCEDERYSRTGVCINCDAGMCRNYFHTTCAQREGLLSEASPEEVKEIADPFFAYCKLHADKTIMRSKRRNWLALQSYIRRHNDNTDTKEKLRIQRKLQRHREKYLVAKSDKSKIWVPTQKMPRLLTTSPSACRKLYTKADILGLNGDTIQQSWLQGMIDIRKKWHIPPAFNVEFVSYYLDRNERLVGMKTRLDELLVENSKLREGEKQMTGTYEMAIADNEKEKRRSSTLTEQATKLWKIINAISLKKHPLPDLLKMKKSPVRSPTRSGRRDSGDVSLNACGICRKTRDQHQLAKCDTCHLYYHLGCLDPPLTRMPKKTKQQGWQCSECDKDDDDDCVNPDAPRRLREHIKEPVKFSSPTSLSLAHRQQLRQSKRKSLENKRLSAHAHSEVQPKEEEELVSSPTKRRNSESSPTACSKKADTKKRNTEKKRRAVGETKKKRHRVSSTEESSDDDEVATKGRSSESPPAPSTKAKRSKLNKKGPKVPKDIRTDCCRCENTGENRNLVRCDECERCFHYNCLDPPRKKNPKPSGYTWHCEDCDKMLFGKST